MDQWFILMPKSVYNYVTCTCTLYMCTETCIIRVYDGLMHVCIITCTYMYTVHTTCTCEAIAIVYRLHVQCITL